MPTRSKPTNPTAARRCSRPTRSCIATGTRPYHPPDVDFEHPRIFDSDTILDLNDTPQSITVYGAGVIGCEYTSMFRNLGVKVNLINTRDKLLEFLDDEIIDALSYHLRDQGVLLRHNEHYERIEPRDDGVVLHLKIGQATQDRRPAVGQRPHRQFRRHGPGGDRHPARPPRPARGQRSTIRPRVPHIYAVGDVIGFPSLASAAYVQGRFAATHVITGRGRSVAGPQHSRPASTPARKSARSARPSGELTEEKVPYEIGHALFKSLARAQITGQTVGMLKLLFHRETLQILGIHCFGQNASEIIHIGQAIMSQSGTANSLLYFINTTFNYPTMAEAYRVAALNGYNRLF